MKKIYVILSAVAMFIASCQQPEKVDSLADSNDVGAVENETALKVASNFNSFISVATKSSSEKTARISTIKKTLKKITPVKNKKGELSFYVITYKEGGFVLVSGDKRAMPVLAFSETDDFPISDKFPDGVITMINYYHDGIVKAKASGSVDPVVKKQWEQYENTKEIENWVKSGRRATAAARTSTEPVDPGCQYDTYDYVAPLLVTSWGQECGYNDQMSTLACGPCAREFAGCVPVAIGQILRYHQSPNTFNWAAMANTTPTAATAALLRNAANNTFVSSDCAGTWASQNSIRTALVNSYGYTTGISDQSYNVASVKSELRAGRPVIMTGFSGSYGHAWICDGFLDYYECNGNISTNNMHMNWGWNGAWNGAYQSFTANGFNFNTNLRMVIGIRP